MCIVGASLLRYQNLVKKGWSFPPQRGGKKKLKSKFFAPDFRRFFFAGLVNEYLGCA